MKAYFACALLIGFAASTCFGQFTPVIAKRRVIEEQLDASGNVLSRSETLGRYLRTSSGATLVQIYSTINGKSALHSGQLLDYDHHSGYDLDYARHEAVARYDLPNKPAPDFMKNANSSLGEETVAGLHCVVGPAFQQIGDRKVQIGRAWVSREYSLGVKNEVTLRPPGGPATHQIEELYDITLAEPDPKEFTLDNFSVLQKQPAALPKTELPARLRVSLRSNSAGAVRQPKVATAAFESLSEGNLPGSAACC
jgi:hypothetical protein